MVTKKKNFHMQDGAQEKNPKVIKKTKPEHHINFFFIKHYELRKIKIMPHNTDKFYFEA